MKRRLFTGAGVAIVTPMHPDGSVNFSKLGELIDWQIENGTDAIIACGTTGESATLNHEEHTEVIRYTVNYTNGRVPVIVGAGSNDTAYAKTLARSAKAMGADGILSVTPYYNKTSQRGLIRHYNEIADATDLPMIVYNVPSRTGVNILPATLRELSKHENIVAVKEASGSISAVLETRYLCGDALDVYSGNDEQTLPILSLGGIGVISVASNILPRQMHNLCKLYFDGRIEESMKLQISLCDIMSKLFIDVNPIPVKEAMNMMRMDVGECRLPLVGMTDEAKTKLFDSLKALGLV